MQRLAIALTAAALSLLAGCGAGNGSSAVSQSRTLGGFAIDGYIADAEIRCLDATGATITSARTTSSGAWILRTRSAAASCHTLEVTDGIDVGASPANLAERSPLPLGTRFTASLAHLDTTRLGNTPIIVSPLTSLIHSSQSQAGLSALAARSSVLLGLGLPDSIDPLFFNPISQRHANVFSSGLITAAVVRELGTGILESIAGDGQTVSLDLRRRVFQRVTDSLAASIISGDLRQTDLTNPTPGPDSPLARLAASALTRLRAEPHEFSSPVLTLQAENVATISIQYASRTAAQLAEASAGADINRIAERAASLANASQADPRRPLIFAGLARVTGINQSLLAPSIRTAIANPQNTLVVARNDGLMTEIDITGILQDYLQVAGEQLRFYTTADPALGRLIAVTDFEDGVAAQLPGALSAVALSFTQPATSNLLAGDSDKTVQLGFRVERVDPAGVMSIRLAAIVTGVKIRWSGDGLVVATDSNSTLYGSLRMGSVSEESPLTLANTSNRLANLISTDRGLLRIDLAGLLTALGLNAEAILQTYLSDSALTVESVISDLVLARSQNSGLRRLASTSVSVARGQGQPPLSVTGAGLRGTVTVGR